MYRVIKHFTDLHDNNHPYNVGDVFPREGVAVTDDRLVELAGSDNKQKTPLIELVEDEAGGVNLTEEAPAKKTSTKKTREKTPAE